MLVNIFFYVESVSLRTAGLVFSLLLLITEPDHSNSNLIACVHMEDSD